MIQIENLVKHYGEVKAVQGISFEVNDGEILGFLGANGAGKSTTLKVMTGYLTPTSGNVRVNDLNILDNSLEIRQQVGYLPELNPLYPEMRVYDLLQFTASIRNINGKAFREALARVVDQCGLTGVIHRRVSECSKGYKQRIGLATAMIHDPKILILDEPVTGLDPNQIREIRGLIKDLGREKMVIISSHILQEIEATVDRIVIIDDGEIVADGTSAELMSSFRGKTRLVMEVKNADSEQIEALGKSIESVEITGVDESNGKHFITLEYEKQEDPREAIFMHALAHKWVLLEMSPQRVQLEDVFRNLTVKGGGNA
ncbi:MAG: ATP-binding cassette domain-containing protein [FCB group bacterium]|nr:ATP-binding cassette domain-containing protein [FCB group bacterium]